MNWWWLYVVALVVASNIHGRWCGRHDVANAVRRVINWQIINGHGPQWMPVSQQLEMVLPPK